MAIAFRALTTAGDGNGASLTINKPSGVVADDVQILNFYMEHGTGADFNTVSVSGGAAWTQVHQTFQSGPGGAGRYSQWTFIQRAGGSEPASYSITWTGSGSFWRTAILAAFSGVDTTTAQDATATEQASGSSSTSATAPGLTTVTNDAMLVYCETDFDGRTVTPPSGMTEPASGDFGNCAIAYVVQASAGASGNKTGTLSAASWNTAQLLALRPAGGAAPTAPPPLVPAVALQPLLAR